MEKKNVKTRKATDLEKFVAAVDGGDNVSAQKLLEKALKAKAHAKIRATLDN